MEIVLVAIGFLGMLAWGERLVHAFLPRHSDSSLERALTGFGLLFGAGAFLIHTLGFLGLLYRILVYAFLVFCATGIGLWVAARRRQPVRPVSPDRPAMALSDRFLLGTVCLLAALNLLGCLTPEIRFDCLINHQSIPAGYANAHRIDMHPFNMNMGRPQLLHMYYILTLLFQNVFGPKLIHSMIALVGLAAMGWLAARTCERGAIWPSVYLFYSLPVVTLYATCAYIDLGRIYFEVFPLWLILRYQQERRRGLLVLAGVIFGFGMAVHWVSWFFGWPALTATVFVAVLAGGGEGRWKRSLLAAFGFGLLSFAVFSPWLLRNWIVMGNPCQALLRTPGGVDQPQQLAPQLGEYLSAIKRLPLRVFESIRLISKTGNCPPILLVAAILLKFVLRDRDPRRTTMVVFAVLHLLLFAVTLPQQDGRYILPGFAVSVVVFFHYIERLLAGYRQYRPFWVAGVLLLGLINFATTKHRQYYDFKEPPWPVYSRAAVKQFLHGYVQYRQDRLDEFEMVEYLNEQLPPGSRVLLDDMTGPLYVWRAFMARNNMDPRILQTLVRRTQDNEALLARLRGYRLTHVLDASGFPPENLDEAQTRRLRAFVGRHLRRIHQVGRQNLYEIVD